MATCTYRHQYQTLYIRKNERRTYPPKRTWQAIGKYCIRCQDIQVKK